MYKPCIRWTLGLPSTDSSARDLAKSRARSVFAPKSSTARALVSPPNRDPPPPSRPRRRPPPRCRSPPTGRRAASLLVTSGDGGGGSRARVLPPQDAAARLLSGRFGAAIVLRLRRPAEDRRRLGWSSFPLHYEAPAEEESSSFHPLPPPETLAPQHHPWRRRPEKNQPHLCTAATSKSARGVGGAGKHPTQHQRGRGPWTGCGGSSSRPCRGRRATLMSAWMDELTDGCLLLTRPDQRSLSSTAS